jgi:acylphosphatase
MDNLNEKAYHLYFEGRVQGVGFRFTARHLANKNNIKGWVMNLPDGRVELVAEGLSSDLDNFLEELKNTFRGYITNFKLEELPISKKYKNFEIRFYL